MKHSALINTMRGTDAFWVNYGAWQLLKHGSVDIASWEGLAVHMVLAT